MRNCSLLPPQLPPLGSVGLSAAALALKISSGPVLTAALDFSFSLDGFHAQAAPAGLAWLRRQNRLSGFINAGAVIRRGTFSAVSKDNRRVLSNISLKNYRDLFEEEFGKEKRMGDIISSGLPLGIPMVNLEAARAILAGTADAAGPVHTSGEARAVTRAAAAPGRDGKGCQKTTRERVLAFIEQELFMLRSLRSALTGESRPAKEEREKFLDACDYLWAHFPECAGAGGRRPPTQDKEDGEALSFLKRIRAELDPFINCFELAKRLITEA
jgi:hypothetical protein